MLIGHMAMDRVFSIEAQWNESWELPAAPMLNAVASYHDANVQHRVAKTDDELRSHLLEWDQQGSECCFAHLWFHGSKGSVSVDDSSSMGLDDILCAYRNGHDYNWENCAMHFGSCATMSEDPSKLREFIDETGLSAVSGYEIDVGWIEPLALESMYLHYLLEELGNTSCGATEKHMRIVRDKLTNTQYTPALCEALRFKMVVKDD